MAERTAAELAGGCRQPPTSASTSNTRGRGASAGVPTLDSVLARYRDAALIIEMKGEDTGLGPAVVDAVRRAGASHRVCLGSFSSAVLAVGALRSSRHPARARGATRAFARCSAPGSGCRQAAVASPRVPVARGVRPAARGLTTLSPAAPTDPGVPSRSGRSTSQSDMRRLFDWGVDGIVTDRPDVGVKVRDAWVRRRRMNDEGRMTNDEWNGRDP